MKRPKFKRPANLWPMRFTEVQDGMWVSDALPDGCMYMIQRYDREYVGYISDSTGVYYDDLNKQRRKLTTTYDGARRVCYDHYQAHYDKRTTEATNA